MKSVGFAVKEGMSWFARGRAQETRRRGSAMFALDPWCAGSAPAVWPGGAGADGQHGDCARPVRMPI